VGESVTVPTFRSRDGAGPHGEDDGAVPDEDDRCEGDGESPSEAVVPRVGESEALEQAPCTVKDVERERELGNEVEDRNRCSCQARDDVVVYLTVLVHRVGPAQREVCEVEDDEQQNDRATPAHRAAGVVGSRVVALGVIAILPSGLPISSRQGRRSTDVEGEGSDESDPEEPQDRFLRHEVTTEVSEGLAVEVDLILPCGVHPQEDLEVADEVGEHIEEEADTRDRHDPLESDGGGEEASEPILPSMSAVHVDALLGGHQSFLRSGWLDYRKLRALLRNARAEGTQSAPAGADRDPRVSEILDKEEEMRARELDTRARPWLNHRIVITPV